VSEPIVVDARGVPLSGLVARPRHDPPGAVVVAIPGSAMHAGYFDGPVDPAQSLLTLGAERGFMVWAIDRPGYGASLDLPDARLDLAGQTAIVHDALDAFAAANEIGAGFFLVGHSYGLKLAFELAADPRGAGLLGIDGAGTGLRYAFDPRPTHRAPPRLEPGDRGPSWGPADLYPEGTFESGRLPFGKVPPAQIREAPDWPDRLLGIAADIRVPLRISYGEHDRLWPIDAGALDELRALFVNAPSVEIVVQPDAGHNISLGNTARAYHLDALAFAERCVRATARPSPGAGT
jgi:pimeloyl-ACP methyl ester carboxylesterase